MRNQDRIELNELNKNANGGTELITRRLFDLLEPEELDGIQIITSRVRNLNSDALRIYHLHDLPNDDEASHLRHQESLDRFDRLVFCSNWQYQEYQRTLNLPFSRQCRVIENGVDPIPLVEKTDPRKNPIKIIYTPTPHRGLELLVPAFEYLSELFDYIELDVYSSFKLYGWEQRDEQYQALFERCKNHPRIRYHGTVDYETIRKAYQEAHIFAYPSIWPETSCRCLIEAMMAGCVCVHPNFGALYETSAGLTDWYNGDADHNVHLHEFTQQLGVIIHNLRNTDVWSDPGFKAKQALVHTTANVRFAWPNVIRKWKYLINELKSEHDQH